MGLQFGLTNLQSGQQYWLIQFHALLDASLPEIPVMAQSPRGKLFGGFVALQQAQQGPNLCAVCLCVCAHTIKQLYLHGSHLWWLHSMRKQYAKCKPQVISTAVLGFTLCVCVCVCIRVHNAFTDLCIIMSSPICDGYKCLWEISLMCFNLMRAAARVELPPHVFNLLQYVQVQLNGCTHYLFIQPWTFRREKQKVTMRIKCQLWASIHKSASVNFM